MALIDTSILLSDPDFVDPVQHIYRTPIVNSLGENTLQETCINTYGSVQSISGKAIQRLPEDMQTSNLYSFWLKGTIIVSEPGKYTDILVFKNRRYQVRTVFDWTNWGAGYCEGVCVGEVPAP